MAKHFQKELEKIKKRILSLGALVEDRVRIAAKALETKHIFDAERIIKSDYLIDEEEVEIEEECLKILALHQPVAVDLRLLVATIKINNDLERIADETVNIARRIKTIISSANECRAVYDYSSIVSKVRKMLNMSMDSLVNLDVDTAFKVLLLDDEVDRLYAAACKQVTDDIKKDPEHVEYFINMLLIARHLERIGDHATNLAEEAIYLVEGEIIRHGKYDNNSGQRID
jgi:phosphate transport system protein